MKRILTTAVAAVFAIALNVGVVPDAEAKRLGGGSSAGMKRDSGIMRRDATPPTQNTAPTQAAKPAPAASPTPAPAQARSGMSRWLGPIAGLAAGLGLAALFSHLGMGEEMANIAMLMLLATAIFFVVRMFLRKREPQGAMQYAGANGPGFNDTLRLNQGYEAAPAAVAASVGSIPADFDTEGFVRQAKLNFVRLQAANDRGDMDDIRNFTSPEMFAEIQMQYQERGRTQQQTDVVQLEVSLLDVSNEAGQQIASVRFYGQLREEAGAAPADFDEVWHLSRPFNGGRGWVIAGIQQY